MGNAADVVRQAAAVPVEAGRICMVTSRSGKRWVVPKGRLEPGKSAGEIALQEAWEEAGLAGGQVLAVEGPAWLLQDFDARWDDPGRRDRLLDVIRRTEAEPSLLGASAHLLAVARK